MTAVAEPAREPASTVVAVGVVVPARDEQERIGACLTSVRRALDALPDGVAVGVAVVLDRCRDATPRRVAALLADWPQAVAVAVAGEAAVPRGFVHGVTVLPRRPGGTGVGALRDLGVRDVLRRLAAHPAAGTWLLSTDADTTVPPDWALDHLRLAADGAHAVAGMADLVGVEHLAADALLRYHAIIERGLRGDTHRHVYAANLGVRADAYLAVGGFPSGGAGEDHGLWRRLRAAGYTLAQPTGIRVRTSARVHGRADEGLAGLLRSLHAPDAHLRVRPDGPAYADGGPGACCDAEWGGVPGREAPGPGRTG